MPSVQELLATKRYAMFPVMSRNDLLTEWPELQNVDSFVKLGRNPKQLLFVYHYAAACSEARKLTKDEDRIQYAIAMAYGEGADRGAVKELSNPNKWSSDLKIAIEDMRRFNFGVRVRNKLLCDKMLSDLERIIGADLSAIFDVPVDDSDVDEEGRRRYTVLQARKDAMAAMDKAVDLIPKIQRIAEGSFGITEVNEDVVEEKRGQVTGRMTEQSMEEV